MRIAFCFLACLIITSGCSQDSEGHSDNVPVETGWTIMVYADADNNLESSILEDVAEMKLGFIDEAGVNLILLIDRGAYSYDSEVLGGYFTDTRMYRIFSGKASRIYDEESQYFEGLNPDKRYEANMGDPETLKSFIGYCKTNYPADKYGLIISSHGSGPRKKSAAAESLSSTRGICQDETNDYDSLYTAEITDVLSEDEAVDFLGFDSCMMGNAEVAYQYRPGNGSFSADYMAASPAAEWSYGWDYRAIFSSLDGTIYDPHSMTGEELGQLVVSTYADYVEGFQSTGTMSCYDLSKIEAVKNSIDELAVEFFSSSSSRQMAEAIRGSGTLIDMIYYFDSSSLEEWVYLPMFDIYDFAAKINDESSDFTATEKQISGEIMNAVESCIVSSWADSDYNSFTKGSHGISFFFPEGDYQYNYYDTASRDQMSYSVWVYQWWYNAVKTTGWLDDYGQAGSFLYGNLAWCKDGIDPSVGSVGNWFELLDSWYDTENGEDGGSNGYQW